MGKEAKCLTEGCLALVCLASNREGRQSEFLSWMKFIKETCVKLNSSLLQRPTAHWNQGMGIVFGKKGFCRCKEDPKT